MDTRTITLIGVAFFACFIILVGVNLFQWFEPGTTMPGQTKALIPPTHVESLVLEKKEIPYPTTELERKQIIGYLNNSLPFGSIDPTKHERPQIQRMIILYKDGKEEIVLPLAWVDGMMVFMIPSRTDEGYLRELSNGRLKALLDKVAQDE